MDHEITERGFRTYRIEGSGCHGWLIRVTESSIAFQGAHVRIYHGDNEHVQLHVDAAEKVAEALLDFVRAARADKLTEPVYVQDNGHGHRPPAG